MDRPDAEASISDLLEWVIPQSPVRTDALNALVRADDKVVPHLLARLKSSVDEEDDEAVRHLLDLGVRLSGSAQRTIVPVILELLEHKNPHVREAAADAVWRLGLPQGAPAAAILTRLSTSDDDPAVRTAAEEALVRLGD